MFMSEMTNFKHLSIILKWFPELRWNEQFRDVCTMIANKHNCIFVAQKNILRVLLMGEQWVPPH